MAAPYPQALLSLISSWRTEEITSECKDDTDECTDDCRLNECMNESTKRMYEQWKNEWKKECCVTKAGDKHGDLAVRWAITADYQSNNNAAEQEEKRSGGASPSASRTVPRTVITTPLQWDFCRRPRKRRVFFSRAQNKGDKREVQFAPRRTHPEYAPNRDMEKKHPLGAREWIG
jgi:hypothetical protein